MCRATRTLPRIWVSAPRMSWGEWTKTFSPRSLPTSTSRMTSESWKPGGRRRWKRSTCSKNQLEELERWHDATLGREDRVQELKRDVNELGRRLGEPVRYPSQEAGPAESEEQNS